MWSVDRWGRLIAGLSVLLFTSLGILHHFAWHFATLAVAANLFFTSLTGSCVVNRVLIRLGAREREDIFLPGGALRKDALPQWQETQTLSRR